MSIIRPRRLRKSENLRALVREIQLDLSSLIYPIFIHSGESKESIASMPGKYRVPHKELIKEIEPLYKMGIKSFCLFPKIDNHLKDDLASYALNKDCFYYQAIKDLKDYFSDIIIMTDVALDPYSNAGHDGLVSSSGEILNDATNEVLAKMSLLQAQAGADIIGPSDMMDNRIKVIREILEFNGFQNTLIMSYACKYCSSFYGPFRDALDSAPKDGDKKTYQMDPANKSEAIKEAFIDYEQGADILMVKPGIAYLDIINDLNHKFHIPISAYQVSGEYSMIKAAAEKNWINEKEVVLESLLCFKRAGAQMILTYFAPEVARWLD